jgi:hypothetical protein
LVSGWEKAVERMGGTSEEAAGSLSAISKALWQVHNMGQALPQELYRLQGGMGKIASTTFDSEHGVIPFMNDIAAQAQKLAAVDPVSAMNLLKGAGISEATANTMIKYGAGMGAYADSLGKSLGPTRDAIKGAQDLQDAWAKVRQTVEGIGNDSIPALDKAMTPVLNKFADFLQKFRDAEKATEGHSVPIPWGQWWQNTEKFFDIGAHGAELPPGFDEGAFESRRGQALSGLTVEGQSVSRGNPLPVDIVRTSLSQQAISDPNALLGGPRGSGGALPTENQGGGGAPAGIRLRGSGSLGTWWTPDRIQHAADRLQKEAGLSEAGAAALVARWAGVEAASGPSARNNIGGGHWGIGQWSRDRGGVQFANASFDQQLGHAIDELKTTESRAGNVLRSAKTPEEGARGASMYERAEHYNPATGTDDWTSRTPVNKVLKQLKHPHGKNAPAWWSGAPLAHNGTPTGGARLSSMAAGHAVTTSQTSNAIHIAKIDVNAPNATDAHGIASELTASLERSTMVMLAQSGQV